MKAIAPISITTSLTALYSLLQGRRNQRAGGHVPPIFWQIMANFGIFAFCIEKRQINVICLYYLLQMGLSIQLLLLLFLLLHLHCVLFPLFPIQPKTECHYQLRVLHSPIQPFSGSGGDAEVTALQGH